MQLNKSGATLLETLIAIALMAIIITTFLQALNTVITSALNTTRRASALDIARSEIEYIESQDYNASSGDIGTIYGYINISQPNYNVSGTVSTATVSGLPVAITALQKITVNVSYLFNKSVSVTAYKVPVDSGYSNLSSRCLIVTDVFNVPILPPGGFKKAGTYWGYYHVIESKCIGNISSGSWGFSTQSGHPPSAHGKGNSCVAIYTGIPAWTLDDGHGGKLSEGMITTGGNIPSINLLCSNCVSDPWEDVPYTAACHTGNKSPGTYYTVLFWNGIDNMAVFTQSASASYFW
jgi:Tfp pilus assembly protein PilV